MVFVTLNRVFPFSNPPPLPPPPPLLLTDNIKLDRYQPKLNEKYTPFVHCILKNIESTMLLNSYKN